MDEEGFETVQSRRATTKAATATAREDAPGSGATATDTAAKEAGDAAAGDHSGGPRDGGDAGGGADVDNPGDDGDGGEGTGPEALRKRWEEEAALVRQLAKQGIAAEHPAMEAACRARDSAEQKWREAKDPAPLGLRLSRAQTKLDKAIELQGCTRTAMSELEADFRAKYAALQIRMEEDQRRVAMRRQQLAEIQEEAGSQAPCGVRRGGGEAIKKVCSNLRGIAPALSVLAGQLDAQTPAWRTLNEVLGSLASSHKLLEDAVGDGKGGAQAYDIGDAADGRASEGAWSESHDLAGHAGGGGCGQWQGDGHGDAATTPLWQGPAGGAPTGECVDQDMGSGQWWEESPWTRSQARWREDGFGKWSRYPRVDWYDAWESAVDDEEGHDVGERAAKFRKQGAVGEEGMGDGTAMPITPCTGTSETAAAAAAVEAKALAERAALITQAAINAGVQPITPGGQELHLLDAGQLDAWAAENLQHLA